MRLKHSHIKRITEERTPFRIFVLSDKTRKRKSHPRIHQSKSTIFTQSLTLTSPHETKFVRY